MSQRWSRFTTKTVSRRFLIVADQPKARYALRARHPLVGTRSKGVRISHGRSGWFLFRRDDRGRKLTHENSHVVGTTFLRTFAESLSFIPTRHRQTTSPRGQMSAAEKDEKRVTYVG